MADSTPVKSAMSWVQFVVMVLVFLGGVGATIIEVSKWATKTELHVDSNSQAIKDNQAAIKEILQMLKEQSDKSDRPIVKKRR